MAKIIKESKNPLLDKMAEILTRQPRGKVLDLGCGGGSFAKKAKDLGFDSVACDIERNGFGYHKEINFIQTDVTAGLPFRSETFDLVFFLEVIEHLRNPYFVLSEIRRVLRKKGTLWISTPNIMNLKSRMRFLFEGSFDFFREPPLDQKVNPNEKIHNIHIFPIRIHDLEYLLIFNGFSIENIFTSIYENKSLSFLLPLIKLQAFLKQKRALKKKGVNYSRINKILLSPELLFGRHLLIKAVKEEISPTNANR